MPDRDRAALVAAEWVEKAEGDLKVAAQILKLGAECPTEPACFHAQQCVEKYLKSYLTAQGIEFPKTHDVAELLRLVPPAARPDLSAEQCRRLTFYATAARYPGDYEPIPIADARHAVALARRVRRSIRRLLPGQATRRRRP
jgi:HEPN domain-containing protein